MSSRHRRSGFTLIELLVVMAIIATLVGLLLPAVQKVREAAYRTKCSNNLKQLATALVNIESQMGMFPGTYTQTGTVKRSWIVDIMPYIEQQNLQMLYKQDKDWTDAANDDAVRYSINTLECPSSLVGRQITDTTRRSTLMGITDYVPIRAVGTLLVNSNLISPKPADPTGPMAAENKSRRVQDIRDGASQTLLLVEDTGAPEIWRLGRLWTSTDTPAAPFPANITQSWARHDHDIIIEGMNADGTVPSTGFGTCAVNCNNLSEIYALHTGAAVVAFADGHVGILRQNININVLSQLATRRGGETVSAIDYE